MKILSLLLVGLLVFSSLGFADQPALGPWASAGADSGNTASRQNQSPGAETWRRREVKSKSDARERNYGHGLHQQD